MVKIKNIKKYLSSILKPILILVLANLVWTLSIMLYNKGGEGTNWCYLYTFGSIILWAVILYLGNLYYKIWDGGE